MISSLAGGRRTPPLKTTQSFEEGSRNIRGADRDVKRTLPGVAVPEEQMNERSESNPFVATPSKINSTQEYPPAPIETDAEAEPVSRSHTPTIALGENEIHPFTQGSVPGVSSVRTRVERRYRPAEPEKAPEEQALKTHPYELMGHESLYAEATQKLEDARKRGDLSREDKVTLEGLENEFNSLFKMNYEVIRDDMTVFHAKRRELQEVDQELAELTTDLLNLQTELETNAYQEETDDIARLAQNLGVVLDLKPGEVIYDKQKLVLLEELQSRLPVGKRTDHAAIKVSLHLLHVRKRVDEAQEFTDALTHVKKRQADASAKRARIAEEGRDAFERANFRRQSMHVFIQELDDLEDKITRSLPQRTDSTEAPSTSIQEAA